MKISRIAYLITEELLETLVQSDFDNALRSRCLDVGTGDTVGPIGDNLERALMEYAQVIVDDCIDYRECFEQHDDRKRVLTELAAKEALRKFGALPPPQVLVHLGQARQRDDWGETIEVDLIGLITHLGGYVMIRHGRALVQRAGLVTLDIRWEESEADPRDPDGGAWGEPFDDRYQCEWMRLVHDDAGQRWTLIWEAAPERVQLVWPDAEEISYADMRKRAEEFCTGNGTELRA